MTATSSFDDSAFTTDEPTPWRPPETAYPPPPNLPPAWRTVSTTSTVERPSALWMSTGDASTVVDDADAAVWEDRHVDVGRVARERFVHRVIHDLVDEVVEPRGPVDPMYMPGALANRFETLEYLDFVGAVFGCALGLRRFRCHG